MDPYEHRLERLYDAIARINETKKDAEIALLVMADLARREEQSLQERRSKALAREHKAQKSDPLVVTEKIAS